MKTYITEEIKAELEKFKLPWITRVWKKYGWSVLRFSILPAFAIATIFGIIYNESVQIYDWMWVLIKTIGFIYIFGFGLFGLIAHFIERIKSNKLRKKLKLSHYEFKILVETYNITGM